MAGYICGRTLEKMYDAFLGGVPFEPPAHLWFGLTLAEANRAGLVVEPPRSAGYRRVRVPNDAAMFPPTAAVGVKANARPVKFPAPTGDWGLIRGVFVATDEDNADGEVLAMIGAGASAFRVGPGGPPVVIGVGEFLWGQGRD